MPKKRFGAEQIVTLLRQIEVSKAQGKPTPVAEGVELETNLLPVLAAFIELAARQ